VVRSILPVGRHVGHVGDPKGGFALRAGGRGAGCCRAAADDPAPGRLLVRDGKARFDVVVPKTGGRVRRRRAVEGGSSASPSWRGGSAWSGRVVVASGIAAEADLFVPRSFVALKDLAHSFWIDDVM